MIIEIYRIYRLLLNEITVCWRNVAWVFLEVVEPGRKMSGAIGRSVAMCSGAVCENTFLFSFWLAQLHISSMKL